jgi:hypothetical protein
LSSISQHIPQITLFSTKQISASIIIFQKTG